jgi:catecholate siderophore receptor
VIARDTGLRQLTLSVGGVTESLDVTATTRVASRRYARPLSETPQSIQVIPRQVMEAQGVTTLSEALRNVPGISLQAGEGGGASNTSGDMFNLRGFSANNSLFVDGVRDDGLVSATSTTWSRSKCSSVRPAPTSAAAPPPATST